MKISTKLFNQQQVSTFSKLTEQIQSLQSKISSGKNFVSASDDPVAAAELSGLNTVKERFNQYSENAISGINRLNIADASASPSLEKAKKKSVVAIISATDLKNWSLGYFVLP